MRKNFGKSGEEMKQGERGFMLLGLIVAIFFILLALSVAAPKVAEQLRRDKEVETIHRGNQYVRAIRLYYNKTHTYPGSIEQLEKTNNMRFLRQQYVDPLTGKADWRLIHVGEAKTTVKGFFGQPLAGLTPGLGSAAGMASGAPGSSSPGGSAFGASSGSSAFGSSSPGGLGGSSGMPTLGGGSSTSGPATLGGSSGASGSGLGSSGLGSSGLGSSGPGSSGPGTTNNTLGSASGIASQSTGGMPTGGAPFVGVGVPKEGDSITVLNEQTTYNTWEFIYDPRIEQLYAKGALMGGGATGLGSAAGNSSGVGAAPTSGFGTSPTNGPGAPTMGAPVTPPTPPPNPY